MPVADKEMKTDRYTITPTDIWGTPVSDILADILGIFFTYTQNINQCTRSHSAWIRVCYCFLTRLVTLLPAVPSSGQTMQQQQ